MRQYVVYAKMNRLTNRRRSDGNYKTTKPYNFRTAQPILLKFGRYI